MTSVLAKTTREILSEYAAYMGTNRCRLVPISAWEALLSDVRTLKPQLIEPLCGHPISVVDVKGRARELAALRERDFSTASAISFLVADVRRFGKGR